MARHLISCTQAKSANFRFYAGNVSWRRSVSIRGRYLFSVRIPANCH